MGNWFCRVKKMRVMIFGLDAVGKTTLLYTMKLGEAVKTIPTIGFNVEILHMEGAEITFWDVGGRDKMRALWHHYMSCSQGFMFMIDSTDTERLQEAISDFISYVLCNEKSENTVIMVLANKQDVEGAMPLEKI